ncbi:MAG: bifunctional phosphopantothenoylcysteine decarboxylase/phosphopantothenate--cysteine ligase CoaBC [Eubacteriales bacterium]|nr:bifunctional phosphopantothenoylcysteine decarboxylase/phosphopantothenate--cysteine ligase CoaBC [Christensenellaceae bacterium]MDY3241657.1 bifunctional phosphopantothenoylcysteine decarboxylase/phosphopantothenate--cysteine ligase CoaBC [Eubacteriales bacterium]MCI7583764.1 bifunctional phosphopantothenoylcysteine decarboxylase/phosphopantothenate--cysteine ligase CoaBC [Christensenellaceae bacterium]MCI7769198.1 bifunctional phosphopantothenoylcysteine decarboxylase/phosphopantothenate--c
MLKGKTVVLGVTGCIAAYKACEIVSALRKKDANVVVIMTPHATEFVQPLSFETLSGNRVVTDLFDRDFDFEVEHVSLAKKADVFVIAPATANTIGKIANGIADDMLTTTIMACKAPKIVCPAMNTNMYENENTVENIERLKKQGYKIIEPISGRLACGDVGKGKMAEPETIVKAIEDTLMPNQDYEGVKMLVTAGSTEEKIDGVRYITNHSSGKMGLAIATAAVARGAEVTLIAGRLSVSVPDIFEKVVRVKSTNDMLEAVMDNYEKCEYIVKAAAPADYRVKNFSVHKIKAQELKLELEKTPDIAKAVGEVKGDRKLIIFSAETDDLIENAKKKLVSKNADMVVANDVTKEGAGFNVDTNIATIITRDGKVFDYDIMPKNRLAEIILDRMLEL